MVYWLEVISRLLVRSLSEEHTASPLCLLSLPTLCEEKADTKDYTSCHGYVATHSADCKAD